MEFVTEIAPGLAIVGGIVLWAHACGEVAKMKREISSAMEKVSDAESWDEARKLLKGMVD